MTISKNGKIKVSFILVFFYLSALFTYLFKLSWNHYLEYCTRLCKIHFMFHLCCWFSSAVTYKQKSKVSSNLARLYKSIIKCETRCLRWRLQSKYACIFFYFIYKESYIVYPDKPFFYRRRKLSKNHIYLRTLCWKF